MIGNSNNEYNFPHKLSLTNIQVSRLRKRFENDCTANIKWLKTQIGLPGEFLGRILGSLFKNGLTILIISNEEIIYIMRIAKWLEESSLLVKGISKKIKNEAKEQKDEFLGTSLDPVSAILLGNL